MCTTSGYCCLSLYLLVARDYDRVLKDTFGILVKSWNLFWSTQWEPYEQFLQCVWFSLTLSCVCSCMFRTSLFVLWLVSLCIFMCILCYLFSVVVGCLERFVSEMI